MLLSRLRGKRAKAVPRRRISAPMGVVVVVVAAVGVVAVVVVILGRHGWNPPSLGAGGRLEVLGITLWFHSLTLGFSAKIPP